MAEKIGHNCGVVAVVDLDGERDVVPDALHMASELQHRGQLAWGRAGTKLEDGEIWNHTARGRILEQVDDAVRSDPRSPRVIAHTRYATNQCLGMEHPVLLIDPKEKARSIAFAFNGNIPDTSVQVQELRSAGIEVSNGSDTEMLAQKLALRLRMEDSLEEAIRSLGECDGAMNGVILTGNGHIAAFRDRHGFHPLVHAVYDGKLAVASEDHAIRKTWPGCNTILPIEPGTMIEVEPGASPQYKRLWEEDRAHCFFEWTYFGKRASTFDGTSVYQARLRWGEMLADHDAHWTSERFVVPVPDSAKIAAAGYSDRSNQPYHEVIQRTRDGRTFIEPNDRAQMVIDKYKINSTIAVGKDIVLVEDSIVRGTTMRYLVERIRNEARPASIHLRIACPPILHPCYYGIDFKTREELLVPKHTGLSLQDDGTLPRAVLEAIARDLKVDSIRYLPLTAVPQGLQKAFGDLCQACVTGRYPTPKGRELHALMMAQ